MAHIWIFSPSSQELVHKCIAVSRSPDNSNKWTVKFGCRNLDTNYCNNRLRNPSIPPDLNTIDLSENAVITVKENCESSELNEENFEDILEVIEQEPILKFYYLIDECKKNVNQLNNLANKLSVTAIEKICKHIFDCENMDSIFVNNFHQYFIPNFFKREYNWLSLDVMVRSHRIYPEAFRMLLFCILKDLNIANNILQDFIATLNEEEMTNVMVIITEIDLTSEEFKHNLLGIFAVYKDCKKSIKIQNFILANMLECAQHCSSDKQFGRLLLACLQAQKELKYPFDVRSMERILELHKSPFRRPCLNVFNELVDSVAMDMTGNTTIIY